jgi:hypothetical protein
VRHAVIYLPNFWVAFQDMTLKDAAGFVLEYNRELAASISIVVPMCFLAQLVRVLGQSSQALAPDALRRFAWCQASHDQARAALLDVRAGERFPLLARVGADWGASVVWTPHSCSPS